MSNSACPHCQTPLDQRDHSAGTCSRCGQSLFAFESPQAASTSQTRRARRYASAWSYWWIPLLILIAMRACRAAARLGEEKRGGMYWQQQMDNAPRNWPSDGNDRAVGELEVPHRV